MTHIATARPNAARPALLALSAVGFIASAPALADPAVAPDETANVVDGDQQDILVDGARLRSPKDVAAPLNTPRSTVELPAAVIQQTGSATLADALRTVPGITFGAAEGGNPVGDRPFIRGFDSQGSTFVDGVRDIASQSREVFDVDSVQIVRGSDSTLGGRGSAGGTINILTKLPQATDFARAAASYGTDDYKRVTVDVNRKLGDFVGVRIAGMWHDQDFAGRDAIYARRWGVAPSITLGMNGPTQLTASYYYLESHELPDSGIPYLYTIGNAPLGTTYSQPAIGTVATAGGRTGTVGRSTFYGLADRDFRDTKTQQATIRVQHDFGTVTLRNIARFSRNDQSYIYTQPDDTQGNVFGTTTTNTGANVTNGGVLWRRANTRYGYETTLVDQTDLFGTFATGGIKHSFAVGVEVGWEQARRGTYVLATGSTVSPRCNTTTLARYYCTSIFSANPYDPWVNTTSDTSAVATPIVKSGALSEIQNDATTYSAYGFDSVTLLPALILNLGVRFDRFRTTITPATATGYFPVTRTDDLFNWQAGLVVKPTAGTSLYASYATSATPPNSLIGEGSDTNGLTTATTTAAAYATALAASDALKVEKTRSYEVGAKGNLFDQHLALTLAAFQTDTDNARVTGPDGTVSFIGKRRIRGVELTANGTIVKGWTIFGGYTHLDPVITDGGFTVLTAAAVTGQAAKTVQVASVNTGRQAPQTARDSVSLTTQVGPFHGFSIGGGAYYTSRVFGGYSDNRTATQNSAGVVTVVPATKLVERTIPGYTRFDANASYAFSPQVKLSVNVQNLTDKVYFTQAYSSHYATIAPGRSAFATLNLDF